MELRLDEILVLDVLISGAMAMFVSVCLSFSFSQITEAEISGGLFALTVLCGLALLLKLLKQGKLKEKVTLSSASKAVIGLLVSFSIGFLLVMRAIPVSYWRGWDPWMNTPVVKGVVEEGFNPLELGSKYAGVVSVGISGFYHFLAAFKVFTGISFYSITRYGGPVLAGIASMITYLVVRRLEGEGAGFLASFFLFLNPFVVTRFSMALREYFSFVFFLGVLFLLVIRGSANKGLGSRISFSLLLGLFLATTLCSHSLVPIIAYAVICFDMVLFRPRDICVLELILALFFSLVLAIPYMPIIVPTFAWVIRNQFLVGFETAILLIALTIGSLLAFVYFHKRLRGFNFSEGRLREGVSILSIVLFLGAFHSILFPKTFTVLGSYNPHITLENFAVSILPLAFLGFVSAFWFSMSTSVLALSLVTVLIMNATNLNVAFPMFRLVVYISWLLAYGAAKCLNFVYSRHRRFELKFPVHFSFWKKKFEIRNLQASLLVCVTLLTLLSPMIRMDLQVTNELWKYPNYNQKDVDSTLNFLNLLEENDIVVPQGWTQDLLIYAGIDLSRMISNGTILQELYSTNTPENFSQIILSKYPNASRTRVFIIERKIGNKDYPAPSLELLELWGEKHQLGSIVFYTIPLPLRIEERELLESPIRVKLPAGPQWVYINLTGVDLSQGISMTISILNNATSKTFFAKINDMQGNSTEKIIYTLQLGDETYNIPLRNLKEIIDLSNPSTLTLCFSWYGWEPTIDLTIVNITLMTLRK